MIDFDRLCMMFTMQEPFYGIILQSMIRQEDKMLPTLGVRRSGNCFRMGYNPDFVGRFNVDTNLQILKHEVLHIALDHFGLWDAPPEDDNERFLRNLSADLEVNSYLDRSVMQKEAGGVWPEDFGFAKFEGTREYYRKLKKMMEDNRQQSGKGDPQNKPCNGGQSNQPQDQSQRSQTQQDDPSQQTQDGQPGQPQSGQGQSQAQIEAADKAFRDSFKTFDGQEEWPDTTIDSLEAEELRQMIDQLLDFAAEETEKSHGSIPSEMVGRIEKIRKRISSVNSLPSLFASRRKGNRDGSRMPPVTDTGGNHIYSWLSTRLVPSQCPSTVSSSGR